MTTLKCAAKSFARLTTTLLLASVLVLFPYTGANAQDSTRKQSEEDRIKTLERKLESVMEELKALRGTAEAGKEDKIADIEKKLEVLAQEIENIKQAAVVEEPVYEVKYGRAPAASKVYGVKRGLSIGGYGEVIGEFRNDDDNIADALRAILYAGYKFTDRIVFNSEIEFEHGSTSPNLDGREGEVSVEFASVDFLLSDYFNLRTGVFLVPFGIINEIHEPTTFHGVLRPDVETQVIPSTWREIGAGIFGTLLPGLSYRAYVQTGLDSRGFRGSNLRGARTKVNRTKINDIAFSTRLEYEPIPQVKLGSSLYVGNTGQNEKVEGETIDGTFTMYDIDYQFQWRGFESRGLFVYSWLNDADLININNGLEGNQSVGEEMYGFYVEGAYNVLPLLFDTGHYLAPFIRYEQYNTQHKVPAGFFSNPANDRKTITYGLTYKPIPNVVLKLDFQDRRNEAGTANNQFNLGVGWVF